LTGNFAAASNVYEMRTYTYAPGDIPKVLEAWAKAVPARTTALSIDCRSNSFSKVAPVTVRSAGGSVRR
jgi:hypothetical protein